jgi:hypothetical protein
MKKSELIKVMKIMISYLEENAPDDIEISADYY